MSETFDARGEIGIGITAAMIDIGRFAAPAGVEIALEDIGREIIIAWNPVG